MHDLVRTPDHVRTADGRRLRVECSGDPRGRPVFLFHGMPGSRVGPRPRPMFLYHCGARLISFDRPGYGGSDRRPGRRVVDVVEDVATVADALGLDRFAVVGRSGGAPHALACAALLPHRVTRAAALVTLAPRDAVGLDWFAGMAPSNVREFRTAHTDPQRFAAGLIPRSAAIRSDPARLLEELRDDLTDDDRSIVSDNGIRSMLLRNYHEALRTSPYGWIDDALALTSPWGFDPGEIRVPVLFWHGAKDVFSPIAHSSWLAARIPRATAVLDPAAAHFAALRALPTVLSWLLADMPFTMSPPA
ncbi:alpha/beta fold hydrolase [Streptomyces ipomoeae]|uniref:alpha/beta fold hydrolase n=1 Tax=Streptomyces ipomoeae TaxID=103232 RepID=UPI00114792BF|nr:alpha/beta fold hydrolase [Streptomyces ipomoeae]MDX2693895.1 alpha/beta fold hydrolase [Streptomyces ipomoeae]MDX2821972.1 alpha/beta fold hydrolase [Streptomyces ipomoeae]MDX2839795.1 alpha/beta fold hydrolase [Streptomyces ipomoeae]MDX2873806.1 alpha/beta fold hydrolase [Streptomyces ipomoeae]MDX2935219.1 alpha/beta fold hydrolase [Streptomyces ipomoeae]